MKKHDHTHSHSTSHKSEVENRKFTFHKDWRFWFAVVLMLLAMITYVITIDDSVVPVFMRR